MQHVVQETIRRPMPKPTTSVTTTAPIVTTQPVDVQLQQAINTMVGLVVLESSKQPEAVVTPATTTAPTSQPAIGM